ncbi:MAG: hypothetical protein IPM97_05220 [Bdellovibrionaceae bacterium]|nr:hypothetical protein [Pseudobdellovibrionaceae bacterium]
MLLKNFFLVLIIGFSSQAFGADYIAYCKDFQFGQDLKLVFDGTNYAVLTHIPRSPEGEWKRTPVTADYSSGAFNYRSGYYGFYLVHPKWNDRGGYWQPNTEAYSGSRPSSRKLPCTIDQSNFQIEWEKKINRS